MFSAFAHLQKHNPVFGFLGIGNVCTFQPSLPQITLLIFVSFPTKFQWINFFKYKAIFHLLLKFSCSDVLWLFSFFPQRNQELLGTKIITGEQPKSYIFIAVLVENRPCKFFFSPVTSCVKCCTEHGLFEDTLHPILP